MREGFERGKGLNLGFDAKRIGDRIKENAKKARNEEELKIKVEGLIQHFFFLEKKKNCAKRKTSFKKIRDGKT